MGTGFLADLPAVLEYVGVGEVADPGELYKVFDVFESAGVKYDG